MMPTAADIAAWERHAGHPQPLTGRCGIAGCRVAYSELIPSVSQHRCAWPGCRHPDVCEGTHAIVAPRPRRRWAPTRKRGQRR